MYSIQISPITLQMNCGSSVGNKMVIHLCIFIFGVYFSLFLLWKSGVFNKKMQNLITDYEHRKTLPRVLNSFITVKNETFKLIHNQFDVYS